ncbi:hypothetical protein [Blastococcus sp. CCUG 61487]|uniref:hypothetical protein n=1 Tax=Blastococcus sp. CCUG 61487 TaxID=1840703 RepID=UPI0010C05C6D|nr:hypothetical protein [Blastococcus sp. CCUG 61487]TKJ35621.1 hypothetical protein A6V29_13995 [Blastococcus sp. CCUG 61487]
MRNTSRSAALTVALATAVLAGCSSGDDATEADTAAQSAPGTYGSPAAPEAADPTDVATDPAPTSPAVGEGSVRITYADWNPQARAVEAGGIVPDIVEAGGVCTLTLSMGGASATATIEGLPDARSTNCGGLVVPGEGLSPGTWTAVIDYESARTSASSEPVEVQIP